MPQGKKGETVKSDTKTDAEKIVQPVLNSHKEVE
jgi:hypothetical protein